MFRSGLEPLTQGFSVLCSNQLSYPNQTKYTIMFRSKLLILHKLLKSRAHWGYRKAFSQFQPYLYGFRNDIAIINSDKTLICLRRACSVIELIIRSKGHIIIVNTNSEYNNIVEQTAKLTGQSFINHKWIGGLLTNWTHIHNVQRHFSQFAADCILKRDVVSNNTVSDSSLKVKKIGARGIKGERDQTRDSLTDRALYEAFSEDGVTPKGRSQAKERMMRTEVKAMGLKSGSHSGPRATSTQVAGPFFAAKGRLSGEAGAASADLITLRTRSAISSFPRFKKMQKCFAGLRAQKLPDCVIILNANSNYNAICEAKLLKIPIIACVDSNVSNQLQNMITYPIPVNSESVHFIYLFCNCIFKLYVAARKSTRAPVAKDTIIN